MRRSTARWATAIASAVLLTLPASSRAQDPQTPPSSSSQPAQPSASRQQPTTETASPQEHLRQASATLDAISASSLSGNAKSRIADLKKRIARLDQISSGDKTAASKWGGEVAAIDRTLTELIGAQDQTATTDPSSPVGTSGASARTTPPASGALDDATRQQLKDVRTHVIAFAAAMSRGASSDTAAQPPTEPSAQPAAQPPADPPAQPAAQPTTQPPADPSAPPTAQPPASTSPSTSSQQVDTAAVKRHLTQARDALSQMTQLPAASQLTGDARTQVSQLITNFNELITTEVSWRAAFDKVQASLTTLIGEQRTDESPTPTAGTAGAVGTSGTTALDPGIRAKLVEFRTHLIAFEKAAGGGASSPSTEASTSAQPSEPAAAAAQPAQTASSATSTTTSSPAQQSGTAGAVGTSGRTDAPAADTTTRQEAEASAGHSEALRLIAEMEQILSGSSSTKSASAPASLDRAKVEQLRKHLTDLRKAMGEAGK